jgi:hypothetical protein
VIAIFVMNDGSSRVRSAWPDRLLKDSALHTERPNLTKKTIIDVTFTKISSNLAPCPEFC